MPAVHYEGPQPPPGQRWCFVCAFMAKLVVNNANPGVENPPQDMHLVIAATGPKPQLAVATGIYGPLQQFGPVELCWDHLSAINITNLIPAQAMPPPGGVPLLGQGGR